MFNEGSCSERILEAIKCSIRGFTKCELLEGTLQQNSEMSGNSGEVGNESSVEVREPNEPLKLLN